MCVCWYNSVISKLLYCRFSLVSHLQNGLHFFHRQLSGLHFGLSLFNHKMYSLRPRVDIESYYLSIDQGTPGQQETLANCVSNVSWSRCVKQLKCNYQEMKSVIELYVSFIMSNWFQIKNISIYSRNKRIGLAIAICTQGTIYLLGDIRYHSSKDLLLYGVQGWGFVVVVVG